jgi:hypothetical protein
VATDKSAATAQAEILLARAFKHLRDLAAARSEEGFLVAFPAGLEEVEIRVDVRVSESESASVDMRVKGREAPEPEPLDYDEFEDPLLYEDDETA